MPYNAMKKAIIITTIGLSTLIVAAVLSAAWTALAFGSNVSNNNIANSKMLMDNDNIIMMDNTMMHTDMIAMKKGMIERGNMAMGFNQSKIIHHFIATPSGGRIMIVALNSSDSDTIKQIRNHVVDIQRDFSQGNFTKPFFIHAQQVPGTKFMTERKDLIKIRYKANKQRFCFIAYYNYKRPTINFSHTSIHSFPVEPT